MRRPTRYALALCFLGAFAGLATASCLGCDDDEFDAEEACAKIAPAVAGTLERCGLPGKAASEICGVVCAGGVGNCSERTDVDACVAGITSLGCDVAAADGYRNLSACLDVFEKMAGSCDSGDRDIDDDD